MTSREMIVVGLGQAGVQMSNAAWELFTAEHNVGPDGLLTADGVATNAEKDDLSFRTFFQEMRGDRYVPRTIIIDLEPTVVDEIRIGAYRELFHPDQLITGLEDAASNYARGFYNVGRSMMLRMLEQVRRTAEYCDGLQGFILLNCLGGGTGSGFTSLISNHLGMEFSKQSRIQMPVFPGDLQSPGVLEAYNTVLTLPMCMDILDLCMLVQNRAMYRICVDGLHISRPTFTDVNRICATILSSLTSSVRFGGPVCSGLSELDTNLVPFPRIHFPVCCHAPLRSSTQMDRSTLSTQQLALMLFHEDSWMVDLNFSEEVIISAYLQFRGDINVQAVTSAVNDLRRSHSSQFVDWCPTGFKVSITPQYVTPIMMRGNPENPVSTATGLINTTAIVQPMTNLLSQHDVLFLKRSFVHWYVIEGMEEEEMVEAREIVYQLQIDYEELTQATPTAGEEPEQEGKMSTHQTMEETVPEIMADVFKDNFPYDYNESNVKKQITNNAKQLKITGDSTADLTLENSSRAESIWTTNEAASEEGREPAPGLSTSSSRHSLKQRLEAYRVVKRAPVTPKPTSWSLAINETS